MNLIEIPRRKKKNLFEDHKDIIIISKLYKSLTRLLGGLLNDNFSGEYSLIYYSSTRIVMGP